MDAPEWSRAERGVLAERGLSFDTFEAPEGALRFDHPTGWRVDWREDHAVIRHGVPPRGHLVIYPIPGDAPGGERLLAAFLDQFVAPAAHGLDITHLGPLPEEAPLTGARFSVILADKEHLGVALTTVDRGLAVVAAYWVEAPLFRRELVLSLLKVVLGSVDAGPGSPLAPPLPQGVLPVHGDDLWGEAPSSAAGSFGSREGRFALRLPEGWRCEEVGDEASGERGWLLHPPGVEPGEAADVLIALSSEDLYGTLEDTMHEAAAALDPGRRLRLEVPIMVVEKEDQRGIIRLFVDHPEEEGHLRGPARRLWSAGWTDEATVVHTLAMGEANRVAGLLPELTAIAASVKVLAREVDAEVMAALSGAWRYQTYPDPRETTLALEHRFRLRADGDFSLEVEDVFLVPPDPHEVELARRQAEGQEGASVARGALPAAEPDGEAPEGETEAAIRRATGSWDVVGGRLTLRYEEGAVEVRSVDTLHGSMAIIDGMIWQRTGDAEG